MKGAMIANCDACGIRNITVEQIRKEGIDLNICVNYKACIKRFESKGN